MEGMVEGMHKCCIQNRLCHPVRVKRWRYNRGKRVTCVNVSSCLTQVLGHKEADGMEVLAKPTLEWHSLHAELLSQGHDSQLQQRLVCLWGKFKSFLPMHRRGSTCSETALTSARNKTDSNKISSGNIFYSGYKVRETAKGDLLAYSLLMFYIWKLKPFFWQSQQRL